MSTDEQMMQQQQWSWAYLWIDSNDLVALVARIGEHVFVAFDAVWMLVAQYIPLASQALIALPAAKMSRMPILVHCLRVLSAEN